MISENCFLIQKQRLTINTKRFRSMIKEKIRKQGIHKMELEILHLEHTTSEANRSIYGIDNMDMAFIMNSEIESYRKRQAVLSD